ncbi:MAG: aldo/keto reductase [Rhodobacter sp.]|nr:aldo/keto reductase [Rhodobacter sp.]MCY4168634.1 aldo/keto reductase [Rhodobacter sp.]MCY4242526.1 aldo/keto reductase [Rhodobacter sp.]
MTIARPERVRLTDELAISRVLTGLWQVADMERDGADLDPDKAADHLSHYAESGFDTFDMADHYGSAEVIVSRLLQRRPEALAFTKWCPPPGPMSPATVRAGVRERLDRLGVARVDLLQFHWWSFEHPAWLDALHELAALRDDGLIREIGVTNFDAAHLHLALADGVPVRTNQVACSLLDRRFTGPLAETCERHGVRLLAYGTVCGGFLSERWLGQPEPENLPDWSKMKYRRFIEAAGGWEAYQAVLSAAAGIAAKHRVSVTNVATRWVLEQSHVAGVIIGVRPGESDHRADNVRLFGFALDNGDRAVLAKAFAGTARIPGDCGDEYRTHPFLTASGDLSHHLSAVPAAYRTDTMPGHPAVRRAMSGSEWETIAGYCRARRVGERILVSGTTATAGADRVVAPGDAAAQTTYVIDRIIGAVSALGGTVDDIVRTRIYLTDIADTEAVSAVHGRVFGASKPANTLVAVNDLAGDYLVEIEAEAIVSA